MDRITIDLMFETMLLSGVNIDSWIQSWTILSIIYRNNEKPNIQDTTKDAFWKKNISINLNTYRNLHFHVSNKLKHEFSSLIWPQTEWNNKMSKIHIHYEIAFWDKGVKTLKFCIHTRRNSFRLSCRTSDNRRWHQLIILSALLMSL